MATAPTDAANLSEQYAKALNDIRADSQYSATTGAYDESKGVAGRVNQLTSSGSPLFTAAATRAANQSAARGLRNSSIGVQAGQQAVIETATPIATADASLYQQQQLANQQAANDASARNAATRGQIGMLGFSTNENARQFNESLALQGKQLDAQREQFAQQLGMTAKDLELRRDQLTESQKQFLMSLDQQKAQLAQQQSQFDTAQTNQQSQFTQSQSQQAQQFQAQQLQQSVLAKLDADTRTQLAKLDADSRSAIQGSSNISNAWGTMMQSINNIQNNANLDEATKRTEIQNNIDSFQSFAKFWQGTNNVDISNLLNFGTSPSQGGNYAPPPAPVDTSQDGGGG